MIRKKLLFVILFTASLLVVVLALILDYRQSSSTLLSLIDVSQQRRVRLNELSSNLKDIQRSHRGFVITHQPEFLAPYDSATRAVPILLRQIASDLSTGEQKVLVESLSRKINSKIAYVEEAIAQIETGRFQEAIVGIGKGRLLLEDIAIVINRLRDSEHDFIGEQRAKVEKRSRLVFAIVIAGLLTSSVLLLVSISIIYRHQRKIESLSTKVDESVQELEESQSALLRANDELQSANTALQKANSELNDFTYSISHDLKAPLRVISGYCEILSDEIPQQLDSNSKKLLTVIVQNTKRMEKLINDLLELSRLGNTSLTMVEFNMKELVEEVLKDKTLKSGTVLNILPMDEVKGDPDLLRQVWENLVSNAIKFSAHSDKVKIEIGFRDNGIEQIFSVKDSGVGFDPAYSDKLFKVFSRLHGKKEFEGTGAGLAIAKKIIDAHGGRMWAESQPALGATFYFTLPKN